MSLGGDSTSSNPVTTVSGSGAVASGDRSQTVGSGSVGISGNRSQSVSSGSIGVSGQGARYLEQGAVALENGANLRVNSPGYIASKGGSLTVYNGDPNAVNNLSASFADALKQVSSSGATATQAVASQLAPAVANDGKAATSAGYTWKTIAAIIGVLGVVWSIFFRKKTA